jgi:biofilm PGA synthesis N-glycosyltransferase PgaC
METLFWASAIFVAYVFAGYPALLAAWSALAPRPIRRRTPADGHAWPSVSVVLAAHNEGARLPERIRNLLGQRYGGPLEIIVVSDGSTDNTHGVLESFGDRIRPIELPRGGKPAALNAGVAAALGEIIVFADARQRFAPDAIQELVCNFADPEVGGASGALILDCETADDNSTIGEGVGAYWRYEKWLRLHESRVWSMLGATGAIYAMRRTLWRPLPAATLLDDVLAPMRAVLAGKRIVFDERARAFDRVAPNGNAESRRKIRTLAGNYQILALQPQLLVPIVNPVWIQYCSHKIGRLLVPWALIGLLVTSALLASDGWFYAVALIVQLGFYGLAALGGWAESHEAARGRSADELRRHGHSETAGQTRTAHSA